MTAEEVFNQHFTAVFRYFYYKNVEKEDCNDLTQDVFFVLYQKYPYGTLEELAVRKLLFTIATRKYKEYVRQAVKMPIYELEQDVPAAETITGFSEDEPDEFTQETRDALMAAIAGLNPTLRSVVTMRFIDGLTRREIAEKLGISEKDVHTYQKRAIKMLQKTAQPVPPLSYT